MKSWILAILLVAVGILAYQRTSYILHKPPKTNKQKLANEIRHKVALQVKQETGLRPVGTMGQMLHEIQKLGLSFYYYQPVDIVEGRKLLIKAVDTMLQEINSDTRIHPYLIRYPFMPRNVEMTIFLRNPDGRDVAPGTLRIIEAIDGCFCYQIDNPKTNRFTTIYKETYEEALQRLADPSLPLVGFQPDREISPEELARLRKGISFVGDDGAIWHLGENGSWVKAQK